MVASTTAGTNSDPTMTPGGCTHCGHRPCSCESETVVPDSSASHSSREGKTTSMSFKDKFRMRVHHFTFAWFAATMSTGGVSVAVNVMPLYFGTAQYVIGVTLFIIDLVCFVILTGLMITRFVIYPSTLRNCWHHPRESMFIPCFFLSIASIILNINSYAISHTGSWTVVLVRVLFWMYISVTFPISVFLYITFFFNARENLDTMAPTWVLPIFCTMLSGTIASQVSTSQNATNGVPIVIAGFMFQGLGFWIFLAIIGVFFQKIFCSGMPAPSERFGIFMFVGGPGYTTTALVGLGRAVSADGVFYADFILGRTGAADIVRVWADLFGCFFLGFTAWLSAFATVAVLCGVFAGGKPGSKMTFSLSWFSFIFPNVGFTVGTDLLANEFQSEALKIVTAVMTCILLIALILLWFGAIRAVIKGIIMMPGKDEDKAIEAFKGEFDHFEQRYPKEAAYKMA